MISIRSARRAGVPIVAIETADPAQTMRSVMKEANGSAVNPYMVWDIVTGLRGLNEAGERECIRVGGEDYAVATQNPTEVLSALRKCGEDVTVFYMNAHRFWTIEGVAQGIWNLRDVMKARGGMLILLAPQVRLPMELVNDVIVLTDTLPTRDEMREIYRGVLEDARAAAARSGLPEIVVTEEEEERHVDSLLGLSAFNAEQVVAMSISGAGIDAAGLWERKRKMIEQTPGLSVWRGGETLDDIAGYGSVKEYVRGLCRGNGKAKAILFIDELEKSVAGAQTDSTGVSQDFHRVFLTWMQDMNAAGILFVGAPGSGKSAVAKAVGNDAQIPTIAMDPGGMKSKYVGESEGAFRNAFAFVDAVAQGSVLVIATVNATSNLSPELRRRFSLGTFYFRLPSDDVRPAIWKIWMGKYGLPDQPIPDDAGWTGAEIRNACTIAWRLNTTLVEAAKRIVPVSIAAADQIDRLEREAHRKYIDAERGGIYERADETRDDRGGRRMRMDA